ncbi:sensor histidine kinase [Pediococcus parvulus]|uniref:sensor histidine kinase n=1 Tax=Pediococcus parvulus TaxID=54062 RepID=UPI000863646E|nr:MULTISPECIES: HAMP domain-containing sensor histidine kinase [Lactobacillaceae]MCT3035087.1 sensor histidine kinase [Pediococcus parvulus]
MQSTLLTDLHRINSDLQYISQPETNAGVTSNTKFLIIQQLTTTMNDVLNQTRQLQRTQYQKEHQIQQMLLNLTHDIKTPLTVAAGYVQLIQHQPSTATPQTLARVAHNLSSVNYYLHYLMDFNLLQEKSTNVVFKPINLSHFLETELFNFFDDLNEKHLTLTPMITPNITINTDEVLMRRIIQNLVGNWLKYATDSVSITLKPRDHDHILLEFKNATQSPQIDVSQLTNRFYTTDTARTTQSIGLGLSIVQSLVTSLGGKMVLQSDNDIFTVNLIFRTTSSIPQ